MQPSTTKDITIPLQKLKLRIRGLCLFWKPARYAAVIGSSEIEQGPRLVTRPPAKTKTSVNGLG